MEESDLHFKRGDLVKVNEFIGYVNCICFSTRSHLHPKPTTSYFTLTIKGTERTKRSVNLCIHEYLWEKVEVVDSSISVTNTCDIE